MNNNFREGLNALREISDPELIKLALEKITGKKLADYEGVNALVGALMGYYNDEVKKKVSKNGDTMTGKLTIKESAVPEIQFFIDGDIQRKGAVGYINDFIYLVYGENADHSLRLFANGNASLTAKNLKTTNKEVIEAINEIIPSKDDQTYSNHYFHRLYPNYSKDGDYVFEHIFPKGYVGDAGLLKRRTTKELRLLNGSGDVDNSFNLYKFKPEGIISFQDRTTESLNTYQFISQKNQGNITKLWENPDNRQLVNYSVTLNDKFDNYQTLVIELCNFSDNKEFDIFHNFFETSIIHTNNNATSDNENFDYGIKTGVEGYGYKTLYFRDDKRTLFFGVPQRLSVQSMLKVKAIYGINKKVGEI